MAVAAKLRGSLAARVRNLHEISFKGTFWQTDDQWWLQNLWRGHRYRQSFYWTVIVYKKIIDFHYFYCMDWIALPGNRYFITPSSSFFRGGNCVYLPTNYRIELRKQGPTAVVSGEIMLGKSPVLLVLSCGRFSVIPGCLRVIVEQLYMTRMA